MDDEQEIRDTFGRFTQNHPGLKKPGSTNKIAGEIKMKLAEFLQKRFEDLPELFEHLKPGEKARLLSDLLQYVLPKTKELHIEEEVSSRLDQVDFSKLSAKTLKEILNAI
jgi:hypothetical protein